MIKAKDCVCLFGAISGVASGALGAAFGNLGRPIALYESHTKFAVYQGVLNSSISGGVAIIECAVNGNVSAENIAVAMTCGFIGGFLSVIYNTLSLQDFLYFILNFIRRI